MNGKIYESDFEEALVDLFCQEGWQYTFGGDIHRKLDEALLEQDMHDFLKADYPELSDDDIVNVIAHLRNVGGGSDYANGRKSFWLYRDGYNYRFADAAQPPIHVGYINFDHADHNIYRVVNQFEFDQHIHDRRPDVMLFVNGIPVCIVELKNPVDINATIDHAYTQITTRYRRDIPALLKYCVLAVISDGSNTEMGTIYSEQEYFYAWKKVDNDDIPGKGIDELQTLVRGALTPARITAILRDYVYFPDETENENKELEVVCRYPQFFATHKLAGHLLSVFNSVAIGDKSKGGYFFGATGCGKTYIMLFLARQLQQRYAKDLNSPTVLLIVDREDLEDQSIKLFAKSKKFLVDDDVDVFDTRDDLERELKTRTIGGVYVTTIQKFTSATGLLSDRANIVCFSDEAHRTQNNTGPKLRINDDAKKGEMGAFITYGFAKYLRDALPNATYVGFTGTPIDEVVHVFGAEVDRYTMRQSNEDGITVPIKYEGRITHVLLDQEKIKQIEAYYKVCADEGASEKEIAKSKKAMSSMEMLLGEHDRLVRLANDIVCHYEKRTADSADVLQKAMIVCSTRKIAFQLYKLILELRPDWGIKRKTADDTQHTKEELDKLHEVAFLNVIATSDKDDPKEMCDVFGSKQDRKRLADDFKDDRSNFRVVIVVDMWITGFDCPSLTVMYNDKPLQKHTLIQTISRVNRKFPGKEYGLIVDYIGIRQNMLQALKQYGGDDDGSQDDIQAAHMILINELDSLRLIIDGYDLSPFLNPHASPLLRLQCLQNAAEYLMSLPKPESGRVSRVSQFHGHVKRLSSAYNICNPAGVLTAEETAMSQCYMGISSFIQKMTSKGKTAATMNKAVERMVTEALQFNGVQTILNADSEEDIYGDGIMRELEDVKMPNTKFQLLVKLLKKAIKEYQKTNKLKAMQFAKMLKETVDQYNDRKIKLLNDTVKGVTTAVGTIVDDKINALTGQLKQLFEDLKKDREAFKKLGITFEEKAFYDILVDIRDQNKFDYEDDKCKDLAKKIKTMVDDTALYADWLNNDNLKSGLSTNLTKLLYNNHYPPVIPPDRSKDVFDRVIDQVENYKYGEEDKKSPSATYISLRTIHDVNEDAALRQLINTMMQMEAGTSILCIIKECFNRFGEKYYGMKQKSWYEIVNRYVKEKTQRYDLQPDETFKMRVAEPND